MDICFACIRFYTSSYEFNSTWVEPALVLLSCVNLLTLSSYLVFPGEYSARVEVPEPMRA